MKKLKYILLIFIVFITPNVFASEFNMNNYTSASLGGTKNRYRSTEIYNTGISSTYTFGTRYNGRVSDIETYFDYPFSANTTYTLTYNMATDDFRNNFGSSYWWYCDRTMTNNNATVVSPIYVSMRKVKLTFTTGSDASTCIRIWLRSNNLSSNAITGISNWQLNNITIYDPDWQSGTSSSTGSQGTTQGSTTGTSNSNDNSDIISSSNQNTQDIITSSQQNSQDIINNNNQNTQDILNGIDNVNNQLGNCVTNLLTSFYDVNANYNMYLADNKTAYQIQADNYTTPRNLKFQLYTNSSLWWTSSYTPTLSTGRYNFTFTYNNNVSFIVFGIGGENRDTTLRVPLENLDLENEQVYTFSYTVLNATDGSVSFNSFSLVRGNYTSNVAINYGKGICTSKLDDFITSSQQNSQDIINNNNQNTQDIINSNKVCQTIDKNNVIDSGHYLGTSGQIYPNSAYGITDYIDISNSSLTAISTFTAGANICFYGVSKNLISCTSFNSLIDGSVTIPSNSYYFRSSIYLSTNRPSFKLCKDGNQAINDILTDDSEPFISDSEFTNLFNNVGFNDPLSYLLQLPVQFINQLVLQSNTCQTISLGTLWGVSLSLPCIDIGLIIGQQVWDTIDVLFSVGLLVVIFKNLYQTFANLMTMGGEKEAREKFSMPTPMEFLSIILGGDR